MIPPPCLPVGLKPQWDHFELSQKAVSHHRMIMSWTQLKDYWQRLCTSSGKFPAKTLSSKVQSRIQFCLEKQPLWSSMKSSTEHNFVPSSNPSEALQIPERNLILFQEATSQKLYEVKSGSRFCSKKQPLQSSPKSRAELNFVLSSDLSKALRSPERNANLFREVTDSLRKKKAKCSIV